MMDLCVAGLPIRVESADKEFFGRRYADYKREDDREPVMEMTTQVLEVIPTPQGELQGKVNAVQLVRTEDGRLCRYARNASGEITFAIYSNEDYSKVDIQLYAHRNHPHLSLTDWEYVYTGFSFQNRLAVLDGGVLHSSSLAWKGQGIAFSAPSGTGKSTHVGLWKKYFGDEVEVINDDKPAIRFEGEQAMLCGTPWSGKTDQNLNRMVPLKAIVFLERGETNSIRRFDTVESMFNLTTQIVRPYYDAELGVKILDFTEKVLQHVPIYCLTCNISDEAVETVFQEIFGKEDE